MSHEKFKYKPKTTKKNKEKKAKSTNFDAFKDQKKKKNREIKREKAKRREEASSGYSAQRSQLQFIFDNFGYIIPTIVLSTLMLRFLGAAASAHKITAAGEAKNENYNVEPQGNSYKFPVSSSAAQSFGENPANQFAAAQGACASQSTHEKTSAESAQGKSSQKTFTKLSNILTDEEASELFKQLIKKLDGDSAYTLFEKIKSRYLDHTILGRRTKESLSFLLWKAIAPEWNWSPERLTALIDAGADVNANAAKVFKYLGASASAEKVILMGEDFPILAAIKHGNLKALKVLLKKGANPNVKTENREKMRMYSAVHYVIQLVDLNTPEEILKVLVQEGKANVNVMDADGYTPLHHAVVRDLNPNIVEILLKGGANLHLMPEKEGNDTEMLHNMYRNWDRVKSGLSEQEKSYTDENFIKIIQLFKKHCRYDMNKLGSEGNNIIYTFAKRQHQVDSETLKMHFRAQISLGANPYLKNALGESAADLNNAVLAEVLQEPEMKNVLDKNGFYAPKDVHEIKYELSKLIAISDGRAAYKQFQKIKQNYLRPEIARLCKKELSHAYLYAGMATAWNWELSEIEELLALGADVDASPINFVKSRAEKQEIISEANDTPLFTAIKMGDVARVKFLVDHGANVNRRLQDKMRFRQATSLLFLQGASNLKNKKEISDILLKAGANPNVRNSGGNMPLFLAARLFEVESIESLLKGGARANVKWNNEGVIYDVLFYMYAQKLHVDQFGQYDYPEVYSDDKFIKIIELCVKHGYQLNAKMGIDGGVLLHKVLRIASGFSESFLEKTFRALIMQGANPYAADFSGMRPVDMGNPVFAKVLDEPEVRNILNKNKFIDNSKMMKNVEVVEEEKAEFLISTIHAEVPGETAYIQFTMLKKSFLEHKILTPKLKNTLSVYLVNAILEWNWTVEQIEDLILSGADVNADLMLILKDSPDLKNLYQNDMLYKPIFVALNNHKFKVVELLIKHGAFANDLIQDKVWKNASPLIQVIDALHYKNKKETVELLLDQHVDVTVLASKDFSPLFAAVRIFDYNAIKCLLENGADIDLRVKLKGAADKMGLLHFFYAQLLSLELKGDSKRSVPTKEEIIKILNVFKTHGVDLNQKDQRHGGVVEFLLMQSHIPGELIDKYLKISIEMGINPYQKSGHLKVLSSVKHYPLLTKAINDPKSKLILEENGFYSESEIQVDDDSNAPLPAPKAQPPAVAQTPPDSGPTLSKYWGLALFFVSSVLLLSTMFILNGIRRRNFRPLRPVIPQPHSEAEENNEKKKDSPKEEKPFTDEEAAQEKKSLEDLLKKLKTTVENKTKDVESKISEYFKSEKVIKALEKMRTRQDNINKLYVNNDKIIELSLASSYLSMDKSAAEFLKIKGKLASFRSTLSSLQKSPEKLSQQLEEEFKIVKDRNSLHKKKQKVNSAIQAVEEEMVELGQQFLEIKKKWENDIEEYEAWISNVSKSQASSSSSFAPKSPKFFPPGAVSAKVKFNDLQDVAKAPGHDKTSSSSTTTESINKSEPLGLFSSIEVLPVEPVSQEKMADFKKVVAAYCRFKEHYAKRGKADTHEHSKKSWRLSVAYDIAMIVNALLEMYIKENNAKNEDLRGKFSMLRGKLVRYVFDLSDRYFEDAESLIVKYLGPISQIFQEKEGLDDNRLREFADIFQVSDMYLEASVINFDQKKGTKVTSQNIEKMKNALKDIQQILSPLLPLNSEKLKTQSSQYDAVKMLIIYLDFIYHPIDKKYQVKIPETIQAYFSVKENNRHFSCGLHKMRSEHLAHNMEINDLVLDQYVITLSSKLNSLISEFDAWQQTLHHQETEMTSLASESVLSGASSSSSVSTSNLKNISDAGGGHVAHGSYWRPKQKGNQSAQVSSLIQSDASEKEKKVPVVENKTRKKK